MATKVIPKGTEDLSSLGIAAGDSIFIGMGDQSISAGIDFSGGAAMVDVTISGKFTGNFGTSSTPAKFGATGIVTYEAAYGGLYAVISDTGSDLIARFVNRSVGGHAFFTTAGTITNLHQLLGKTDLDESVLCTNAYVDGGKLTQQYNATGNTLLVGTGPAEILTRRSMTTGLFSNGCKVTARRLDLTTSPGITATTLSLFDASLDWWGAAISTLNLYSAESVFNWRDAVAGYTIGTVNGHVDAIRACGLRQGNNISNYGQTVVVTTLNPLYGRVED